MRFAQADADQDGQRIGKGCNRRLIISSRNLTAYSRTVGLAVK
jgi:hypothetical protein